MLESPFGVAVTAGVRGFVVMVEVDVEELEDDIEEEELVLWGPFLCGINMRDTSSALIELNPPLAPLPPFQPSLGSDWKLGGDATAVVMRRGRSYMRSKDIVIGLVCSKATRTAQFKHNEKEQARTKQARSICCVMCRVRLCLWCCRIMTKRESV